MLPEKDPTHLEGQLKKHVEELAGRIGIRHDSDPSSIEAAVTYLKEAWGSFGFEVEEQPYTTAAMDARNLVVEWPGNSRPDEVVVIGAHYDTVRYTPGADDNASAVATLLEVSRLLAGKAFTRTIRFVAFANEEPPHFTTGTMGSRVYANRCKELHEDIRAMVCLEMLGYYSDAEDSQAYPDEVPTLLRKTLPTRGNFLAAVSDLRTAGALRTFSRGFKSASSLKLVSTPLPGPLAQELWLSDHGPFWDRGYKALMLTDTSWFRNPNYHEASDLPDTLDYARLTQATLGVAQGVRRLAGG